jgi:hypothetical protein
LRRITTKLSGCLVQPQTKTEGAPRSFDAGGRVAGLRGLRQEDAVCGDGVAV